MEFTKELKRLGLKDKEAAVYLACLELGPSTAQQVSRKSKVVRATTYVELESLMQMGLVAKFKEGKKTLFSAEPPRQLMRLLERRREELEEKQHDLEHLLPELQVIMKTAGDRPTVRYFEGKEGLHAMRQDFIMYCTPEDTLYSFTPADHLTSVFPDEDDVSYKQRVAKGIHSKTLFTTKSPALKKAWLEDPEMTKFSERRFISPERFPIPAGMTIYKDRVAIGSFTGKLFGTTIESESISQMMRSLFELAWDGAEKS